MNEQLPFDHEMATARYQEIMAKAEVPQWPDEAEQKELDNIEYQAGLNGYSRNWLTNVFEPMGDLGKIMFRDRHTSEQSTENTEAIVWHVLAELVGTNLERRRYHMVLRDGDKKISFILNYEPANERIIAEPYVAHEMDYTVHDACNHSEDQCVLEDPTSQEYHEMEVANKYARAWEKVEEKQS